MSPAGPGRDDGDGLDEIVDCVVETPDWDQIGLTGLAERAARATLRHLHLPEAAELSLLATDDARIAALNAEFREKPGATNVLSWPAADLSPERPGGPPALPEPDIPGEPVFLGDIALSWETCRAEAETGGKPLPDHVTHLVVHGLLHLLGYDHISEEDAVLMEGLEVEILRGLGLPDPYTGYDA